MTPTIDTLLAAVRAEPREDAPRHALADELADLGLWTRQTVLSWVLAYRTDDGPRLLYADWCAAHGEVDRAELIRVQVELARTPQRLPPGQVTYSQNGVVIGVTMEPTGNPKWHQLGNRSLELFRALGPKWFADLPGECHVTRSNGNLNAKGWKYEFDRGFLDTVSCSAELWLEHADALLAEHPVEKVHLTSADSWNEASAEKVRKRWPEIEFEIPFVHSTRFTGAAGNGDWSDPGNWSDGVPSEGDSAIV